MNGKIPESLSFTRIYGIRIYLNLSRRRALPGGRSPCAACPGGRWSPCSSAPPSSRCRASLQWEHLGYSVDISINDKGSHNQYMFTDVHSEAQSSISTPIRTHDILLSEPEIHTFQTNRFLSAEWKNTQGIYTMDPKSEFHQMHHIYLSLSFIDVNCCTGNPANIVPNKSGSVSDCLVENVEMQTIHRSSEKAPNRTFSWLEPP